MKIYSKRHKKNPAELGRAVDDYVKNITLPVLPKGIWDMPAIKPEDFLPMPPPISAVELQEAADLLQRGIISSMQYWNMYNTFVLQK